MLNVRLERSWEMSNHTCTIKVKETGEILNGTVAVDDNKTHKYTYVYVGASKTRVFQESEVEVIRRETLRNDNNS